MKAILKAALIAALLAGCAGVEPMRYDPMLADYLVRAEVAGRWEEQACGNEREWHEAHGILAGVVEVGTAYAEYTADAAVIDMARDAAALVKRDGGIGLMGLAACQESAKNVQLAYRRILLTVSRRDR